jgi:hypothetical protein
MEYRYEEDRKLLTFKESLSAFLKGAIRNHNIDEVHLDTTSMFYSIPGGDIPLRYGCFTFKYRYSDGKYIFYV